MGLTQEDIDNLNALTDPQQVDPLSITPSKKIDMEEVETLGGTVKLDPSRVTGVLEEGYGKDIVTDPDKNILEKGIIGTQKTLDTAFGPFLRGFNKALLTLPDMAINAALSAYEAATGTKLTKDILLRIFNSGDFESQKVLIPYILNYGMKGYVGEPQDAGMYERYSGAMGEGTGFAVPFIGMVGKSAQLTAQAPKVLDPSLTTRVVESITKPFTKTPATAVATESGLSAVSLAGMQAEEDLFGTQTGIGGLLPLTGPLIFYGGKKGVITPVAWVGRKTYTKGMDIRDNLKVKSGEIDPTTGKRGEEAKLAVDKSLEEAARGNEQNIKRLAEQSNPTI